jgi:hypothetical protein
VEARRRPPETAVLAIACVAFVGWCAAFIARSSFVGIDGRRYFCLFDDAMISMRYAWNAAHGAGLVWNPGERIEGFTNLLMALFMSLAALTGDRVVAVLVVQIAGIAALLGIAWNAMQLSDHLFAEERPESRALRRSLVFGCALAYYPAAYWSLMGMETGLLTLLTLLGLRAAFEYAETRTPGRLWRTAVFFGLAFLTRNDSILVAALVVGFLAAESLRRGAASEVRRLMAALALYAVFVGGQLLFQYAYYGEALPNTYTLKLTGMPLPFRIRDGIGFVRPFLGEAAAVLILAVLAQVLEFGRKKLLLLAIGLTAIAYQVYVGGDPWDHWRMMAPVMPLLFMLAVLALDRIARATAEAWAAGRRPRSPALFARRAHAVFLTLTTLLVLFSANARFGPEAALVWPPFQSPENRENVDTAIVLSRVTTPDATVGVFWAGAIPYYSDRRAIDFLGKSDRRIARLPPDLSGRVSWKRMRSVPGHNKYDLDYSIRELQPTFVQGFAWGADDVSEWARDTYVTVVERGLTLRLRKDSPAVRWERLERP